MIYTTAIILHFLFDWILQSREVAVNKSKDLYVLNKHIIHNILPYITILYFYLYILTENILGCLLFVVINIITHYLIDCNLHKIFKPKSYEDKNLWNMIAVDQMLHLTILTLSITYLI